MRRTLYAALASVSLAQGTGTAASEGAAASPAFVPMTEIIVPIVDGGRAHGRLRVKLVIVAHDGAGMAAIRARMPALRETALIATAEFARLYASPFAPVDAARLSRGISVAMSAEDGDHAIARVLLVGVFAARS